MKKVVSIFSVLFFLAMFSTVALAADPVLYLDASNNPGHPDVWTNLGTAGGELSGEGNPPVLEEGAVERPDLGIVIPNAMFYTAYESGQCFGGPGNTVELFVEDWTIEFVCKRNGGALGEEHQLLPRPFLDILFRSRRRLDRHAVDVSVNYPERSHDKKLSHRAEKVG